MLPLELPIHLVEKGAPNHILDGYKFHLWNMKKDMAKDSPLPGSLEKKLKKFPGLK